MDGEKVTCHVRLPQDAYAILCELAEREMRATNAMAAYLLTTRLREMKPPDAGEEAA